jgi:membrane protein DedA with SNARE-associated domain
MQTPSWIAHGLQTYGYWIIFVAVGLESMGVPFPGETVLLAGAIYAGVTHQLSITLVIAAAAAGAILGDNLGFTIGYRGGYPLIQRIGRVLHLDLSGLRHTQYFFERHGDKTVFVGRFFSILRTYVALFAGINRMRWRTFLIFNAAGGITWALLYGLLGYFLGRSPVLPTILRVLGTGGLVLLALAVVGVAILLVVRRRRIEDVLRRDAQGKPGEQTDELHGATDSTTDSTTAPR